MLWKEQIGDKRRKWRKIPMWYCRGGWVGAKHHPVCSRSFRRICKILRGGQRIYSVPRLRLKTSSLMAFLREAELREQGILWVFWPCLSILDFQCWECSSHLYPCQAVIWPNLISKCSREGKKERQGNEEETKRSRIFFIRILYCWFLWNCLSLPPELTSSPQYSRVITVVSNCAAQCWCR